MDNVQRREELRISIESKMESLKEVVKEYDELGGGINCLSMLYFDNDEIVKAMVVGETETLGNMILSSDDVTHVVASSVFSSMFEEAEDE